MDIKDIHTHIPSTNAIISINPTDFSPVDEMFYSVGIHPWNTLTTTSHEIDLIHKIADNPQVVAIGEAGLDKLKGAPLEIQKDIFINQINLSEKLHKPLIIHSVKSANEIIQLRKLTKAKMPWIIHGFRGNENIAKSFVEAGIALSFGTQFNQNALLATPENLIFAETDESTTPIDTIIEKIAHIRGISKDIIMQNIHHTFIIK